MFTIPSTTGAAATAPMLVTGVLPNNAATSTNLPVFTASGASTMPQPSLTPGLPFRFLGLAPEVRNMVYKNFAMSLTRNMHDRIRLRRINGQFMVVGAPAFLLSSRQVFIEAYHIVREHAAYLLQVDISSRRTEDTLKEVIRALESLQGGEREEYNAVKRTDVNIEIIGWEKPSWYGLMHFIHYAVTSRSFEDGRDFSILETALKYDNRYAINFTINEIMRKISARNGIRMDRMMRIAWDVIRGEEASSSRNGYANWPRTLGFMKDGGVEYTQEQDLNRQQGNERDVCRFLEVRMSEAFRVSASPAEVMMRENYD